MSKRVIIDFDNEIAIYDLPEMKGQVLLSDPDRIEIINSLGALRENDYMDLCKCSIFGLDFEHSKITIYKATTYPAHLTNISLLQEKRSFIFDGLEKHYEEFLAISLKEVL